MFTPTKTPTKRQQEFQPVQQFKFPSSPTTTSVLPPGQSPLQGRPSSRGRAEGGVAGEEVGVLRVRGGVVSGVQQTRVGAAAAVGRRRGRHRRRRHRRTVDVHAGVLLFPLGASVLEPDLHLRLRQTQRQRQVEALAHRQVSRRLELVLQGYQLLVGEGGARATRLAGAHRLGAAALAAPATSAFDLFLGELAAVAGHAVVVAGALTSRILVGARQRVLACKQNDTFWLEPSKFENMDDFVTPKLLISENQIKYGV